MSLDVYLESEPKSVACICQSCGHEHSRTQSAALFDANITHNLGKMASEAGIYEALWRPNENGFLLARHLIGPLTRGLETLKSNPGKYAQFNARNGWGTYAQFIPWVEKYLAACHKFPDARVRTSR